MNYVTYQRYLVIPTCLGLKIYFGNFYLDKIGFESYSASISNSTDIQITWKCKLKQTPQSWYIPLIVSPLIVQIQNIRISKYRNKEIRHVRMQSTLLKSQNSTSNVIWRQARKCLADSEKTNLISLWYLSFCIGYWLQYHSVTQTKTNGPKSNVHSLRNYKAS